MATELDPRAKITVLARENPKRRGARVRFNLYKNGMTVSHYIRTVQRKRLPGGAAIAERDLKWDTKVGHIRLTAPR